MDAESRMILTNCEEKKLTEQPSISPPYSLSDCGTAFYGPLTTLGLGNPAPYNNSRLHTVMVTQPVCVHADKAPWITCALVMSTISALFCGFICGAAGIVFAWKARMQNLKQRYQQARHSLCVAWVFFALAVWFGIIIWTFVALAFWPHDSYNDAVVPDSDIYAGGQYSSPK